MKQRIKDLLVLLKEDRKAKALAGLGLLMLVFLFTYESPKPRRRMPPPTNNQSNEITTPSGGTKEAYEDILGRFDQNLKDVQSSVSQINKKIEAQEQRTNDNETRTATILAKMLDQIQNVSANGTDQNGNALPEPVSLDGDESDASGLEEDGEGFETVGFEDSIPEPPPAPQPQKLAFIGRGDSVRVQLLAGVNAPTDGTPYPVVFKVIGDVIGPDGARLPIGEARIIAAAQGSLSDSRALFRLTDLSVRLPTGERKVYKADGWIVGEDGIRGMKGILIDHFDKALAGAATSGFFEGIAKGIISKGVQVDRDENGSINTVVTGDTGVLGVSTGARQATQTFGRLIERRLEQLVPHVQVLSGRDSTAVFARDLAIEGLYESIANEESAFASLD